MGKVVTQNCKLPCSPIITTLALTLTPRCVQRKDELTLRVRGQLSVLGPTAERPVIYNACCQHVAAPAHHALIVVDLWRTERCDRREAAPSAETHATSLDAGAGLISVLP